MPRKDRAQRFLLNPHAFMDDPEVQRMSLKARGAYAILWLAGWDQKEPGVYIADDRVLAQLARCTPEEWAEVREEVSRAFSVTERDTWRLTAFSVTLASQNAKRDMDRERQRRNRLRKRDVTRDMERDSLDGSGSGSGSITEKKKDLAGASTNLVPATAPPLAACDASAALTFGVPDGINPSSRGPRRCTCAQCGDAFMRPNRSQQRLCPKCFVAAASDPSASTG